MIAYPISNGRLINLAMFNCSFDQEHTEYTDPWVAKADAAEVAKLFAGWEPDVEDLMSVRPPVISLIRSAHLFDRLSRGWTSDRGSSTS